MNCLGDMHQEIFKHSDLRSSISFSSTCSAVRKNFHACIRINEDDAFYLNRCIVLDYREMVSILLDKSSLETLNLSYTFHCGKYFGSILAKCNNVDRTKFSIEVNNLAIYTENYSKESINENFLRACLAASYKIVKFLAPMCKKSVLTQGVVNCILSKNNYCLRYLFRQGAETSSFALEVAVRNSNYQAVKYLIDEGVKGINKSTIVAVMLGDITIVRYLLNHATNRRQIRETALLCENYYIVEIM